jgi:Kef-type K+ transport system membrane component KefB/nucleotide-binding universal stress UspA family protein
VDESMMTTDFWATLQTNWQGLTDIFTSSAFSDPVTDPVAVFLIIMAIMLVAPLLFERIRLPGIVGLILAGVVIGPNGLGVLERDSTIVLLGTVGLLFLMFMAGLETSLNDLKLNASKAVTFGVATFGVPMILGTGAMMGLGYSFLAAVLVASCFASHTLLALPVATKLGIMRAPAVTATLGATLITNVFALLVLAVVVRAHQGDLNLGFWLFLIPALTIYTLATLWGVPIVGRWFFRKFGHDEGAEFTFVVATLFVVSYAAALIEIEPIIGAFLAGVAITQLIPQLSPLMNRIQFIGNTLFIPFFLISVGMLVDPLVLFGNPQSLLVAGVMVLVAIVAKLLPAWGSGKLFGYDFSSIMVMFGLSVAQAASTLAAITVAYQIDLVDQLTVNGTIAMILVTCIASPWVTARWGPGIKMATKKPAESKAKVSSTGEPTLSPYRILVPVSNPSTEDNLLQLALILAKTSEGTLLPLHVLDDSQGPISPEKKLQQEQLLETAERIANAAVTPVEPIGRVDGSIDRGIVRVVQERNADLVICGWKGYSTYKENFFGNVLDSVVRRATVPVLVSRFSQPIETIQRILLVISDADITSSTLQQTLLLCQTLATELKATLVLIRTASDAVWKPAVQENEFLRNLDSTVPVQRIQRNLVPKVSRMLEVNDLLILTAGNQPERFGVSALGVDSEALARTNKETSMMILHYPFGVTSYISKH